MSDLQVVEVQFGAQLPQDVIDRAAALLGRDGAENTQIAYGKDWDDFCGWCRSYGLSSMPADPATVVAYIAACCDRLKAGTIERRLTAIARHHRAQGCTPPTGHEAVRRAMRNVRRDYGSAKARKAPLMTKDLREIVMKLGDDMLAVRDRALLLLGFAGAFRRSELVALTVEDVTFVDEGAVVLIRRSKTDQAGEGYKKGIPFGVNPQTCPVRALKAWVREAGLTAGPVFRPVTRHGKVLEQPLSDRGVALVVKRRVASIDLDAREFSGHSLRAGCATQAAKGGAGDRAIMKQTGHRSPATVQIYIRDGSLFHDNAAAHLGL